jgi:peptidoglycan/LPS O-acetylase OafA/YrhL
MSRIPSLDGLRAVAIVLVCVSHFEYMKDPPIHGVADIGNLGVRVFFVISGLLITQLLIQEREQSGRISLKRFYLRRALRIVPAMWFYVAVIAALSAAGIISVPHRDFLRALTYTMNYLWIRSWYLGHIWTLSVEEQFYVLWPLVLCFATLTVARRTALAAVALAPLLRFFFLLWLPNPGDPNREWFITACDPIATGCLLALLPSWQRKRFAAPWITRRWFWVVPAAVVMLNTLDNRVHGRLLILLLHTLGLTAMNWGIALTIERVVTTPNDLIGRFLNSRPVTWLGRISYSLYLWQMPFLNHEVSAWITRLPENMVSALVVSSISFYFIETPILRLRKRLAWGEEPRDVSSMMTPDHGERSTGR